MNKKNFNTMISCANSHGFINAMLSILQLLIKYYDAKQDKSNLDLIGSELAEIINQHKSDIENTLPDE